ncbi:alkaline phosphatase family protein [filamentous cyanobacterium LEGE 11480]|uniref:Alkaline phosphatase family protein n=1 Tax=Romeriopsis navalis LEGE 11480 TaxID=2777977 RepID=A0A928Z383_9CYAN|nr:alkaline phosphatase D family protein [Romeriopsis navalis]MBE9030379.1 alkaline phosphatase family protein [Romeriopsis navalis LEGE 11480]
MHLINQLTVGPIVGHADVDHARIWGRATYQPLESGEPRRAFGIARIKEDGGSYRAPRIFKMNPNFDMSGIVIFLGLEANTKYIYQIGWFFADKELDEIRSSDKWNWHHADQGAFQTASDATDMPREFVFGSCRYLLRLFNGSWFDSRGDKTFRSILQQSEADRPLNKFLMVGDQIYADDLKIIAADERVDEYFARYRDAFTQPHLRQLMSQVSTYMTLDDHEIEDNWPSHASARDRIMKYPAAIHAYQTYQASHSPLLEIDAAGKLTGVPDQYYYRFADGCSDFFVLDTRTERTTTADSSIEASAILNRTILSEEQMQAVLDWLSDGADRVKFIVTTVPFFPDTKQGGEDRWSGYKQQRDQIIDCIRRHQIQRVVFLAGDVHCSIAAELDISRDDAAPLKIYSIISSAFYWPYPHTKSSQFQLTGSVASLTDANAYRLGKVSPVYSGDNFSRVRVSPQDIEVEVYARKGELMHKLKYDF